MATLASATYCVGNTLRHIVLISVALLSLLLGSFFTYLGFTGSWDAFTIIMSLMSVMGVAVLLPYVVWLYDHVVAFVRWLNNWFQGSWDQAKEDGLICTDEAGLQRATIDGDEVTDVVRDVQKYIEMLIAKSDQQQKKIDMMLTAFEEFDRVIDARIKLIHLTLDDLEGKDKEDGNENPNDWK